MPQTWARFPCPKCGKIVQENWGKCLYCGADLKAEKEKLAAQRQAAGPGETAVPRPPEQAAAGAVTAAVPTPDTSPLPPSAAPQPVIQPQPVETKPQPVPAPQPVETPPVQVQAEPVQPAYYTSEPIPPPIQRPTPKNKRPAIGWAVGLVILVCLAVVVVAGVLLVGAGRPGTSQNSANPFAFASPTSAPLPPAAVSTPLPVLARTEANSPTAVFTPTIAQTGTQNPFPVHVLSPSETALLTEPLYYLGAQRFHHRFPGNQMGLGLVRQNPGDFKLQPSLYLLEILYWRCRSASPRYPARKRSIYDWELGLREEFRRSG